MNVARINMLLQYHRLRVNIYAIYDTVRGETLAGGGGGIWRIVFQTTFGEIKFGESLDGARA